MKTVGKINIFLLFQLKKSYYNEQDIKKRQIDTLKVFNANVTEISPDSEYRVDFNADGKDMRLNVILSPGFPNETPCIYLNPPIPHPWLAENSNQVVGAPGLINYTPHSDLGRVVQAIIREFQKSLPNLEEKVEDQPTVTAHSTMFPELNDLTIEELHEILENTDLQDRLLENNPLLVELEQQTEQLMSSIEEIARDNMSKQQMLDDIKTEVINRISGLVQMKIQYEELNKKHQKLCERYSPHYIRESVRAAALKADGDADSIAEQMLTGQIPVETFIRQFSEKRALGQARRAREERLAHQLALLDRATT